MGRRRRSRIRCVLFDLVKTLVRYDHKTVFARLVRLSGKTEADVDRVFYGGPDPAGCTEGVLGYHADRGDFGDAEFISEFRRLLSIDSHVPDPEIARSLKFSYELPGDTRRLLLTLCDSLPMGIVSDLNNLQWSHVNKTFPTLSEEYDVMSFHVLSYREKYLKPDQRIFERAYAAAYEVVGNTGAKPLLPEECLFFDDELRNVRGAQRFGIEAWHASDGYPSIVEGLYQYRIPLHESTHIPRNPQLKKGESKVRPHIPAAE